MMRTSLFTSASPEWYTPPDLLATVRAFYGRDFFDPCPPRATHPDAPDGLSIPWESPCYVNPPYGRGIGAWVAKALTEPLDEVILLVPARTDTRWFQPLLRLTVCFVQGRLHFSGATNAAPFPSALVYRGQRPQAFSDWFHDLGQIMVPAEMRVA